MTILDSHAHVWDPREIPHPWLEGNDVLNRPFLPADIDTAGGLIDRWIFVETDAIASFARVEADWVASIDWPGLEGIVAHVEMARGDIEHQLDDLQDARLLVGVRPSLQNGPSEFISSPEFAADLREIGERGLAFDACVRWHQLDALVAAAENAPDTRIVLDHLGKPPVLEGLEGAQGSAWRRGIEHLAALPNAFVKCSGMPAEAGEAFDEVAGTFDRVALDAFGADRAMFGGDWPVSGSEGFGVPLARAIDALRAVSSDAEWARLAGDTAREFYRLNTSDV
ncbi:MAG: amidohydrolase family protein [Microbacterium gubbeenense]|uniref:amidohydrolase family protein n=2 Tax=Microbacterium gubbeenense TaxID=159896 RepID=UPI003F9E2A06